MNGRDMTSHRCSKGSGGASLALIEATMQTRDQMAEAAALPRRKSSAKATSTNCRPVAIFVQGCLVQNYSITTSIALLNRGPSLQLQRQLQTTITTMPSLLLLRWVIWFLASSDMLSRACAFSMGSRGGFGRQSSRQATGDATSSSTSFRNLWSIQECLERWNQQQQRQQHPMATTTTVDSDTTTHSRNIVFVDATWFHKGPRDGRAEYEAGPRLPGAVHWDTGDLSASRELFPARNPSGLRNVFPPEWLVGAALENMGVRASDTATLVVYGREGTRFAPRVWYLLNKYYRRRGAVKLLRGSLEEWISEGGPVESAPRRSPMAARDLVEGYRERRRHGKDHEDPEPPHPLISPVARDRLVDKAFVTRVVEQHLQNERRDNSGDVPNEHRLRLVDTRGDSFGRDGSMPGAVHLPYARLMEGDGSSCKLRARDELEAIVERALAPIAELRNGPPLLLSCGTGVSVCTLALALDEIGGIPEPYIYDGSWEEWKQDPDTPKEAPLRLSLS